LAVLAGRQVAQRFVGALLVVVDHPPVRGFVDVLKASKQVLVEHFLAERAVETFDVGVLVGLARLDVLDGC